MQLDYTPPAGIQFAIVLILQTEKREGRSRDQIDVEMSFSLLGLRSHTTHLMVGRKTLEIVQLQMRSDGQWVLYITPDLESPAFRPSQSVRLLEVQFSNIRSRTKHSG